MDTNMNTNMKELNLKDMEMINGGWKLKDGLTCILSGAVIGGGCGAILGGWQGALIGGAVGAGLGACVSVM